MYDEPDLDFLAGMGEENIEEFGAAMLGEQAIREYLEPVAASLSSVTGERIVDMMGTLLPAEDRAALTGEYGQNTAEVFRWAVHTGIDGWLDDDLAFVRPWGIRLSDIANPVIIWQGASDLMVPFTHGQWLADKLPHAEIRLLPGHGHLSIGQPALAEGFAWLAEQLD
jgi:pimeloyl-ACP methyl ester carboxylesterase